MATIDIYVTRDELELADLHLHTTPYTTASFRVGHVTKEHHVVRSRWLHGAAHVGHPTKAEESGTVRVELAGNSTAYLELWVGYLTAALDQSEFELHRIVNGVELAWRCYGANYVVGWDDQGYWEERVVPITFTFPYAPVELAVA